VGGIVDPETGQIVWSFTVPLDEQRTFYRAHPPRALLGLRATPTEADWRFDGHGEPVNAVFAIACSCGCTQFTVLCGVDEDSEARPPIEIECGGCDATHLLFDDNLHGFDAEAGGLPEIEPPPHVDELVSEHVDAPHEVIVRFEYPSDHLGAEQWQGREPDLFSWITVLARDPVSGRLAFLFDEECA
jgi:hypothetical protein